MERDGLNTYHQNDSILVRIGSNIVAITCM